MNPQSHVALKLGLLATLYFSQGLPFGFFSQALPVLLREQGYSLSQIGLTSLLALPWALKFLWAPAVDRVGTRRSWIIPLQLSAVVLLALLAMFVGLDHVKLLMVAVFLLNLIAATQDVATDGFAVDMLAPSERGFANGLQVAGYRVGMIVGGGALLIWHDVLGSAGTFGVMSAMTLVATLPILLTREAPRVRQAGEQASLRKFFQRADARQILAVVLTYKAGDAFGTAMLRPFLSDAGLDLEQIGWMLGTVGFLSGLAGALLGGALVNVVGRTRSLLVFGAFQASTVGAYAWLAATSPGLVELYILTGFEHFAGGMATAALFTCMMDWSRPESAATDYTVQASAVVIATGLASTVAGFSAQAFGYTMHFIVAMAFAFAALLVVRRFAHGLTR